MTNECKGQCHGCAFKSGAIANQEPDNRMRGIFAALGGYPFYCHESMGWKPGSSDGYPKGATEAVSILAARPVLLKAGAKPELIQLQVAAVQKDLRICGGWKWAVRRLKAKGWFSNRDVMACRQIMAKQGASLLERLSEKGISKKIHDVRVRELRDTFQWLLNDAKESRTRLGFLLDGPEKL